MVHLAIDRSNAPYVITKPLHHTQKVVAKSSQGIEVILNFELEGEILGFGDSSCCSEAASIAREGGEEIADGPQKICVG